MMHAVRHLDLFVTESCNLACPYCFARNRSEARDISVSTAHEAISWLCSSRSERVHVTLWGGEPLLRLPLLESLAEALVRTARDAGKEPTISLPTNGTLLTGEALDWMARFGIRTFLSIDGGAETQAGRPLASGGSSHELAYRGLHRAMARLGRRRTTVRMTVTPGNAPSLAHNVRYFAKCGVGKLMVYPAYDMVWSERSVASFARSERELAGMLGDWLLRSAAPHRLVRLDAWLPVLRMMAGRRRARGGQDAISPCGVGTELLACNTDGSVSPCHRFTFYERSRGLSGSLGTLSSGLDPSRQEAFRGLSWSRQQGVVRCTDCDLFELCSMGCVAINFATTGQLLQVPSWACGLQRARVEACRSLHERCAGHPAYEAYLGEPDTQLVRNHAGRLGRRAAELYQSLRETRREA
ncbi:MAG: radical SAM protein [Myxococcota bacterium]